MTRDEALRANYFHTNHCTKTVGPRGGVTYHIEEWRRNGNTKTWKRQPERFEIPVKYSMRTYNYITNENAANFHTPENCPLRNEEHN